MASMLGDRYLRSRTIRPYHEAEASEAARARAVPTPRVVAAAMYPAGPFYRADMVTEFIPGASDLVEALFDTRRRGAGGAAERLDSLRAAGDLIRQMARAGLRHRDLHAGNILLQWEGATPRPYLLDLDRCVVGNPGRPISPASMHRRLRRSLSKWERRARVRITEREWQTLEDAVVGKGPR
jgi:tRNA A-37 threonylcarbamoyl transferase component Bud32